MEVVLEEEEIGGEEEGGPRSVALRLSMAYRAENLCVTCFDLTIKISTRTYTYYNIYIIIISENANIPNASLNELEGEHGKHDEGELPRGLE